MEECQVASHHPKIVAALFGEDAIVQTGRARRIHESALDFAADVTVNAWNAWRTGIKRNRTAIAKLEVVVDEQWEGKRIMQLGSFER